MLLLIELWALGLMSAKILHEIGRAAMQVAPRPPMAMLAGLGKGHYHRDLSAKLRLGRNNVPQPYMAKLLLRDGSTRPPTQVEQEYPILFPHEFLSNMHDNHFSEFQKYCVGSEPLAAFWNEIPATDNRLIGHPVRHIPNYQDTVIPLRLHGDGVPIARTRGRSLDCVSLSSMVGFRGSSWDSKWLLFGIVDGAKLKQREHGTSTMDRVWVIIQWCFRVLLSGCWPALDWERKPFTGWRWERRGQPLAGNYRFAMFEIACDLDYACNYLSLQHFGHGTHPCFRCNGNRTTMPISDLRMEAAWRRHCVDIPTWYFMPKHSLFADPQVGMNVFHLALDVLHVMDLGVLQHICASCIYLLVFDSNLRGQFEDKANTVWRALAHAYEELGTTVGERFAEALYSRMFDKCGRTGSPIAYPQLFCKGAIARHIVPVLLRVVRCMPDWAPDSLQTTDELDVFRCVCDLLGALAAFYDCIFPTACGCRRRQPQKHVASCSGPGQRTIR